MRRGDVVNGYRVLTEPSTAGGGMSQWVFAEKDGQEYFLKMFLSPKFPRPDSPGTQAMKQRKMAVCLDFEARHLEIMRRVNPGAAGGGNIVHAQDFFRIESTYCKVSERVHAVAIPPFVMLSARQALVILRTLVLSVRLLHSRGIVHGDLKPDNVLLQPAGQDLYATKLIDLDEAYLDSRPPLPSEMVGDPLYFSPELLRYVTEDPALNPRDLTTASDVFSLGLVLHYLITGRLPAYERAGHRYPCEAVTAGVEVEPADRPAALRNLFSAMFAVDPWRRPGLDRVLEVLRTVDGDELRNGGDGIGAAPLARGTGRVNTDGGVGHRGAVRISMGRTQGRRPGPPLGPVPRVRSTLRTRRDHDDDPPAR